MIVNRKTSKTGKPFLLEENGIIISILDCLSEGFTKKITFNNRIERHFKKQSIETIWSLRQMISLFVF